MVHVLPLLALALQASAPDDTSPWSGEVGAGMVSLTGNSNTLTLSADADANYQTKAWDVHLELDGAYGTAAAEHGEERSVVAENLAGLVRADRRYTKLISAYGVAEAATDHLSKLELRLDAELGAGFTLLERERDEEEWIFLRLYAGFGVFNDFRFQYFPEPENLPDRLLVGPDLGVSFRWAFNPHVQLVEYARISPNIAGDARFLFFSNTDLEAFLTTRLALDVGFNVDHDSAPAEGAVPTNTSLTVELVVAI